MTRPEQQDDHSLQSDAAKVLRLGGLTTFGLTIFNDVIDGLEMLSDVARHQPVAHEVIDLGQSSALGVACVLLATYGAGALDRATRKWHS